MWHGTASLRIKKQMATFLTWKSAPGADRVTAWQYEENLEGNIAKLVASVKEDGIGRNWCSGVLYQKADENYDLWVYR